MLLVHEVCVRLILSPFGSVSQWVPIWGWDTGAQGSSEPQALTAPWLVLTAVEVSPEAQLVPTYPHGPGSPWSWGPIRRRSPQGATCCSCSRSPTLRLSV